MSVAPKPPPPAPVNSTIGQSFSRAFDGTPPLAIGVAVSGGSDSLALLVALAGWAEMRRGAIFAVTVDHGLRAESAQEAAFVAQTCAALGVAHHILEWDGQKATNNLQDAARQARYGLMADWARQMDLPAIALGHTFDDQAETFLMRLARGSGVDGLACMAEARRSDGILWLRPFLTLRREGLRAYLVRKGQGWIDDPSNDDPRFDRVKARNLLAQLAPLGLESDTLVRTAVHMADARAALMAQTRTLALECLSEHRGDVLVQRGQFDAVPFEIRTRLLAHVLGWVSSQPYRPRFRALTAVMENLGAGKSQTLHGCLLSATPDSYRITREYFAVADLVCAPDRPWDQRWRIDGPPQEGIEVRALGEAGLRQLGAADFADHPRHSRLSLPAIWQGDTLIAAPMPDESGDWTVKLTDDAKERIIPPLAD